MSGEVQVNLALLGDGPRVGEGLRQVGEQSRHFRNRFEIVLRVRAQGGVGLIQRSVIADAGQHVVEAVALPAGVVDVVGGHQAHAQMAGQFRQPPREPPVPPQQVALKLDVEVLPSEEMQVPLPRRLGLPLATGQQMGSDLPPGAARKTDQPLLMLGQIGERQGGLTLAVGQLGVADQTTEAGVPGVVLRQEGEVIATVEGQLRPDNGLEAPLPGCAPEAHRAVQPVVVGDGQPLHAQLPRPIEQVLRVGGSI